MTAPFDPLAETLALLAAFERSTWTQCHVRTGALEVFLSRDPRSVDPMATAAEAVQTKVSAPLQVLVAPHVATLRSISAAGEIIRAGATFAIVEVLDEQVELVADRDGIVAETMVGLGDLIEHDQPLLSLNV